MLFIVISRHAFLRYLIYLVSRIEFHQTTLIKIVLQNHHLQQTLSLMKGRGRGYQQLCNIPNRTFYYACKCHLLHDRNLQFWRTQIVYMSLWKLFLAKASQCENQDDSTSVGARRIFPQRFPFSNQSQILGPFRQSSKKLLLCMELFGSVVIIHV